jgi:hypothetical protein
MGMSHAYFIISRNSSYRDTRQRSWLGRYAKGRKMEGSIPDEVTGFHWNPSSRTMDLGFTQPLAEMSTTNIPGGKARPACKADNLTAISKQNV